MTKQETVQLLAYLSAFWPNWNVTKATVEAWHEMLADLDHGVALMALKRVVARVPHFPTIAEIRQEAAAVLRPDLITGEEAWTLVAEAVERYGYYQECQALDSLPPAVQRAARAIGWEQICLSEEPGVVRAQFIRVYEALARRERDGLVIPESARVLPPGQEQPRELAAGETVGEVLGRLMGGQDHALRRGGPSGGGSQDDAGIAVE